MKTMMILLFLIISFNCHAPDIPGIYVEAGRGINPYRHILFAVGMVESGGDCYAYNPIEGATGQLQIRQIRLDDYYRRTGIRYHLYEMYDSVKSARVFIEYAKDFNNTDDMIRAWNGSGKATYSYLNKVKKYLPN